MLMHLTSRISSLEYWVGLLCRPTAPSESATIGATFGSYNEKIPIGQSRQSPNCWNVVFPTTMVTEDRRSKNVTSLLALAFRVTRSSPRRAGIGDRDVRNVRISPDLVRIPAPTVRKEGRYHEPHGTVNTTHPPSATPRTRHCRAPTAMRMI